MPKSSFISIKRCCLKLKDGSIIDFFFKIFIYLFIFDRAGSPLLSESFL